MNWKTWGIGLLNAAVSGAASGITVAFIDPKDFNLGTGLGHLATVIAVSAAVSAAKWILQHPMPGAPNGNGGQAQVQAVNPTQPKS